MDTPKPVKNFQKGDKVLAMLGGVSIYGKKLLPGVVYTVTGVVIAGLQYYISSPKHDGGYTFCVSDSWLYPYRETRSLPPRVVKAHPDEDTFTVPPPDGRPIPIPAESPLTAMKAQVGGDHYKNMAVQPIEYILANRIPFPEGNIIKYVSRWRNKNGVQDLKKARHMLDVLIEDAEKAPVEAGQ